MGGKGGKVCHVACLQFFNSPLVLLVLFLYNDSVDLHFITLLGPNLSSKSMLSSVTMMMSFLMK